MASFSLKGIQHAAKAAESGDGLEKIKGGEPVWGKLYSGGILCARYGKRRHPGLRKVWCHKAGPN